jgi:predicted helicase
MQQTMFWPDGLSDAGGRAFPRPHQDAALADIAAELAVADRTTLVMACATGKTLTAMWTAERFARDGGLIVQLFPSLALIAQTVPV